MTNEIYWYLMYARLAQLRHQRRELMGKRNSRKISLLIISKMCFLRFFNLYLCVMCSKYMGASGDRKRAFDPLELELKTVLSHQTWVLGPKLGSSGRVASALNHWVISVTPLTDASYALSRFNISSELKAPAKLEWGGSQSLRVPTKPCG